MSHFLHWLEQLRFGVLLEAIMVAAASLICIAVHETCHGLCACWLGDDTAKRMGRLSLNPLRHVDLVGLAMMVLVRFGWAKPVPINMQKFRNPKFGMAITALAGPVSNVLLMLLAAVVRVVLLAFFPQPNGKTAEYSLLFLEYIIILNAGLAVFNLFPIPPLDGSKVLFALLPAKLYKGLMRCERYGMILLMVLLLTNFLDTPLIWMRELLLEGVDAVSRSLYLMLIQLV